MKYKITIFVILLTIQCQSKVDSLLLNDFSQSFFKALKKQDQTAFDQLLINKENFTAGIKKHISDPNKKDRWTYIINSSWDSTFQAFTTTSKANFKHILKSGKKSKINWNEIIFKKHKYIETNKDPELQYLMFKLYFSYKKEEYFIKVKDIILLEDNYYIGELKKGFRKLN
jgi:hypothetical protein